MQTTQTAKSAGMHLQRGIFSRRAVHEVSAAKCELDLGHIRRGVPWIRMFKSRNSFSFVNAPTLVLKLPTPVCTVPMINSGLGVPSWCQSMILAFFRVSLILAAALPKLADPRPLGRLAIRTSSIVFFVPDPELQSGQNDITRAEFGYAIAFGKAEGTSTRTSFPPPEL
jgi:hypothetical protein